MRTRAEWKRAAKTQLGGQIFANNWMVALVATVIFSVIVAAAGTILPGLGALIISGPLAIGMALLFVKQARDRQTMNIGDIFQPFTTDFGGAFLLGLMETIFIALWSLLFVIPGIVKTYAYSMAEYIKADHPEYGWKECLDESRRMTKGHKWELFILDLSFIGWYIIGSLCLGIGNLWVVPYHIATKTQAYLDLSGAVCRSDPSFFE